MEKSKIRANTGQQWSNSSEATSTHDSCLPGPPAHWQRASWDLWPQRNEHNVFLCCKPLPAIWVSLPHLHSHAFYCWSNVIEVVFCKTSQTYGKVQIILYWTPISTLDLKIITLLAFLFQIDFVMYQHRWSEICTLYPMSSSSLPLQC